MIKNIQGNRVTDNALNSDDGQIIITRALKYIEEKTQWRPLKGEALFKGLYYDQHKVGSYIIRIKDGKNNLAVLKIQLRPLEFDEAFIIKYIQARNKSVLIRLPKIFKNEAWEKERGFGYLIFEDLSGFADVCPKEKTEDTGRKLYCKFIDEFLDNLLPIEPWFEAAHFNFKDVYKEKFEHFFDIARASKYKHICQEQIASNKLNYFKVIDSFSSVKFHFTHGHLSGKDVKYDPVNDQFIILANLYWSMRPEYYELTFSIWVDLMNIRDTKITLDDFLKRIEVWILIFSENNKRKDLINSKRFWFNLLERAVMTVMLDLGSSEWRSEDILEKQKLLDAWQGLFTWIIKNKFNNI